MWGGLSYRFPCLFYVGQDRALRFRCSKECDPVEVYLQGADVTCYFCPLTAELGAMNQSVQQFPLCHTYHSDRPDLVRVCEDVR